MKLATLILDSSHKLLAVGIIKDDKIVASKQEPMNKRQSENLIPFIEAVLLEANINKKEITEIVLTDGPGSYTGLRIAMAFTKVFALTQDIKVYTISTLLSVAGLREAFVILDARSKRVFGGKTKNGIVSDNRIYTLDELDPKDTTYLGDVSILGKEDIFPSIVSNIYDLKDVWNPVENIDLLVPRYES